MPNRIYYLRNEQKIAFNPLNGNYSITRGTPIICIVSDRNADTGTIKYGYAIWMKDDKNFSKSEGRAEANKKLLESPMELRSDALTGNEINQCIVRHFLETIGRKNGTARKLSKKWLKVAAAKASVKKNNN